MQKSYNTNSIPIFKRQVKRKKRTNTKVLPPSWVTETISFKELAGFPTRALPIALRPFHVALTLQPHRKVCSICKDTLPLVAFNKLKRKPLHLQTPSSHGLLRTHYLRPYCKQCQSNLHKEWRKKK
jgi:hypothetical protein